MNEATRRRARRRRPRSSSSCSCSSPDRTVDDPAFQAASRRDPAARLTRSRRPSTASDGPVFEQLVDPIGAPAAGRPRLARPDRPSGSSAASPGDGRGRRRAPRAGSRPRSTEIKAAHPAYRIHALNNTLANDEISELVNGGLDASLRLTIPLTFLILLIAFGAVVAAVVPLVLAITALLAAFGHPRPVQPGRRRRSARTRASSSS